MSEIRAVVVVGADPVGLVTALDLAHRGVPVTLFEEGDRLSPDARAGTILNRTLEVLYKYGTLPEVRRIDESDRLPTSPPLSVRTGELTEDTRSPFVNIPQHHLEPVLREAACREAPVQRQLRLVHPNTEAC